MQTNSCSDDSPVKHKSKALPEINAGNYDLQEIADLAWQALKAANKPPFVFRYGRSMALIESDENSSVVRLMTQDHLRGVLARIASWYRFKQGVRVDALPPMHVIKDMLVRSDD